MKYFGLVNQAPGCRKALDEYRFAASITAEPLAYFFLVAWALLINLPWAWTMGFDYGIESHG